MGILDKFLGLIRFKITIEPVILLFAVAYSVLSSAQVQTNLLMWKICHLDMNYEDKICKNLSEHEEIQNEVQIRTNNFEIVGRWIALWPSVVYSFFAGSLSDDYGRKPCMILPLVGLSIGNVFNFINYTWINQLPTEFFYCCGLFWYNLFGGTGVFCLGYYGYGANISTEETRAVILGKMHILGKKLS